MSWARWYCRSRYSEAICGLERADSGKKVVNLVWEIMVGRWAGGRRRWERIVDSVGAMMAQNESLEWLWCPIAVWWLRGSIRGEQISTKDLLSSRMTGMNRS